MSELVDVGLPTQLRDLYCPEDRDIEVARKAATELEAMESELTEWRDAGRQFLESADAIIVQIGSDVLPKGWLATANRLRALLRQAEPLVEPGELR